MIFFSSQLLSQSVSALPKDTTAETEMGWDLKCQPLAPELQLVEVEVEVEDRK